MTIENVTPVPTSKRNLDRKRVLTFHSRSDQIDVLTRETMHRKKDLSVLTNVGYAFGILVNFISKFPDSFSFVWRTKFTNYQEISRN